MECSLCYWILPILAFGLYFVRKWFDGGVCDSNARLDGKVVLITGANTGIGKETAVDMANRGATVVIACRDENRGKSALDDIIKRTGSATVFLKILDLASLKSIHDFCDTFKQEYYSLHILTNNAGVMMCPYMKTEDGFEMQIGVNHFGHFALTNLLLQTLHKSAPSRVVNVSSMAHDGIGADIYFQDINSEKSYSHVVAYSQSKLANVLFTKELHRKVQQLGISTFSLHPGMIVTEVARHSPLVKFFQFVMGPFIFKNVKQGAQTSIYCSVQEGIEQESGLYFSDCGVKQSSAKSNDEGMARKLWEVSEQMTNVKFPF